MAQESIDIYASTNPVFLSTVLWVFLEGYQKKYRRGADLVSLYLPIPLTVSASLDETFRKTRVDTGFFSWLNRNPGVFLGIEERLESARAISADAIKFGTSIGAYSVNESGYFQCSHNFNLKKLLDFPTKEPIGWIFRKSNRLGHWMGEVQSTETILNILGIRL